LIDFQIGRPAWEVERLVWIAVSDPNTCLYGLTRDVVLLLIRHLTNFRFFFILKANGEARYCEV
jgi:hypothetical protein